MRFLVCMLVCVHVFIHVCVCASLLVRIRKLYDFLSD